MTETNQESAHKQNNPDGSKEIRKSLDENQRLWASVSFVAVLIVIGIPLWWKTTEVYRVSLPYDRIAALDESQWKITTNVIILTSEDSVKSQLPDLISTAFFRSDSISLRIIPRQLSTELQTSMEKAQTNADITALIADHFAEARTANNILLVHDQRCASPVWIGEQRVILFKNLQASNSIIEALKSTLWQLETLKGAKVARSGGDPSRRVRMSPSDGYDVTLSVVHPTPDLMTVNFDARETIENFIGSFVDELEVLHNITLKSQWIHLLRLDFGAQKLEDDTAFGRHFKVDKSQLSHVLTPLEKRISSPVTRNPTINLVLYINSCQTSPLYIYEDSYNDEPVNAFMSPKWGGVYISNPSYKECADFLQDPLVKAVHKPDIKAVYGAFVTQLRALLGFIEGQSSDDIEIKRLNGVKPRQWELDALIRMRTLEQVVSAKLTLQSISQLLGEISNIVINDVVGASIKSSVSDIEGAVALMSSGDIVQAYRKSLSAHLAAEAAFTDPSLLALLYFPDDQKYAVYIPLFLPVMIPVLMSLYQIYKWVRGKSLDD